MANWEEVDVDDTGATDVPTASDAELDAASLIFARSDGTSGDKEISEFITYLNTKDLKIVDASAGLPSLSTEANALLYWHKQAALFNNKLWIVERVVQVTTNAAADWTRFTHTNYLGVRPTDPAALGNAGKFYYNEVQHEWREALGSGFNVQWRNTPIELIIDTDHVFVGDYNSEQSAENHITNFTTAKTYLAFFNNRINQLTNTTYVAPGSPTYEYHWIRDVSDNRDYAGPWDTNVDYSEGRIVETDDGDYAISKINDNNGNDPDSDDGTNWYVFGTSDTTTTTTDDRAERAEVLSFAATAAIVEGNTLQLNLHATAFLSNRYGSGAQEMLSGTAGEDTAIILKAGIYDLQIEGQMDTTGDRPIPIVDIYLEADTVGTDEPIGLAVGHYHRSSANDERFEGFGRVYVSADDTEVKFIAGHLLGGTTGTPAFSIDALDLIFSRQGVKGDTGGVGPPSTGENNPDQVTPAEKTTGTETDIRSFSPDDVTDMVEAHESDTDLSSSRTATAMTVVSSNGTNAALAAATATQAGVLTSVKSAKLDGIETTATRDQTDGQIRVAYENNADRNAFTDALLTKLNAIEDGAGLNNFRHIEPTETSVSANGNVITLSTGESLSTLIELGNRAFSFKSEDTNDGSAAIIIDAITAKSLRRSDGQELSMWDMPHDELIIIVFDAELDYFLSNISPSPICVVPHANVSFSGTTIAINDLTVGGTFDLRAKTFIFRTPTLSGTGSLDLTVGSAATEALLKRDGTELTIADIGTGSANRRFIRATFTLDHSRAFVTDFVELPEPHALTELEAIDGTATVLGEVTGLRLFHAVRRHAPDVVPPRFSTVHREVTAGTTVAQHEISFQGSGNSYTIILHEYNDLIEGFFGELPIGTFVRFLDDTVDALWEGTITSSTVDATDSTLYTLGITTTSRVGTFFAQDDMRIEFEYVHADLPDGVIREAHIAGDMTDTEIADLIEKLEVWLYDKKGPLIATSSALPTTASDLKIDVTWTVDGDAPTGVGINSADSARLDLPQDFPYDWCDGLIVQSLVGTTVVSGMKVTWGPGSALENTSESDQSVGALYFTDSGDDRVKVDFLYNADDAGPFVELMGDNDVIPANSTVKVYLAR